MYSANAAKKMLFTIRIVIFYEGLETKKPPGKTPRRVGKPQRVDFPKSANQFFPDLALVAALSVVPMEAGDCAFALRCIR